MIGALLAPGLGVAGLAMSLLLQRQQGRLHPSGCSSSSCGDLADWGRLGGVSLATLGAFYFGLLLLLEAGQPMSRVLRGAYRLLAGAGGVVGLGLLVAQLVLVRGLCAGCAFLDACCMVLGLMAAGARFPSRGTLPAPRARAVLALAGLGGTAAWFLAWTALDPVVLDVAGRTVLRSDMDAALALEYETAREALQRTRRQWLEQVADEQVLELVARRRGLDARQLLEDELPAEWQLTPQVDAQAARLSGVLGRAVEPWQRQQLRLTLEDKAWLAARGRLAARLRSEVPVECHLRDEAEPVQLTLDLSLAHVRGSVAAAVMLTVFADFHCPHCAALARKLERVRARYEGQVAVAFRHLPVSPIDTARLAAVAAEVAARHGRFWEFHDLLMEQERARSFPELERLAGEVGITPAQLRAGLEDPDVRRRVLASLLDARRLGLRNAPALFLNGRLLGGDLPYELLCARVEGALRGPG